MENSTISPKEYLLAYALLEEAAAKYSNHGCNDWTFPKGWTIEERRAFVKEYHEYNGDPEEYNENFLVLSDFAVMGFIADKLKKEGERLSQNNRV